MFTRFPSYDSFALGRNQGLTNNSIYDQNFEAIDFRVSLVIALVLLVSMMLPILY